VFGPWYDHVSGWWEKKQTYSNLLYLFYEDLVEVSSILKVTVLSSVKSVVSKVCISRTLDVRWNV